MSDTAYYLSAFCVGFAIGLALRWAQGRDAERIISSAWVAKVLRDAEKEKKP